MRVRKGKGPRTGHGGGPPPRIKNSGRRSKWRRVNELTKPVTQRKEGRRAGTIMETNSQTPRRKNAAVWEGREQPSVLAVKGAAVRTSGVWGEP